jgi:type II secretory ATPase GspE/PulE/Tfp pilus assembly ATPase PilB-like protein
MPETIHPTLALEGFLLVSWWKPLLLLIPFLAWAWVVSSVYDKHAARFHLPRQRWNTFHLVTGLVAALIPVLMPGQLGILAFVLAFVLMVVVFAIDLIAYAVVANRDDRVPEAFRIRLDMSKLAEARASKASAKLQAKVALVIKHPSKGVIEPPAKDTPEYEIRVAAESLYITGIESRASRVDLAPTGKDGAYAVFLQIDGVRQTGTSMPSATAVKVIDFWKSAAGLDPSDRRRKLTADIKVAKDADPPQTVRLTTSGTSSGMRLTLLFDPEGAVKRPIEDLGLLDTQMTELTEIVSESVGVVLLAAPPSNGRTTTLYTILGMHDAYTSNVQTIEVEPQGALEGVRHNEFDPTGDGPEYSTLTRSILRRDPDVLGVAELTDANTAKEIARVDQDRTRVYVGLRADSALTAVQTWAKAVGDLEEASKALHGVLAQRLLRKLCTNCRVAYTPSPEMLKKLGLPSDMVRQLYKKGGQVILKNKNQPEMCPVCKGTGYHGQAGIFEVFRVGDEERQMLKAGNLAGLRAEWRKRKLPTLQQAALRKAVEGLTSVEEIMRVMSEPSSKQKKPASPKPQPTDAV